MKNENVKKIVWAGLFTALIVLATAVIKFPFAFGYINAGDALVLLSAFFLGPVWGAVVSGVGSALADIMAGYAVYAPATFVIKALMALLAGFLMRRAKKHNCFIPVVFSAVLAEVVMVAGYFTYDALFMGFGAGAAAGIPGNSIQALFGAVAGCALYFAMIRIPYVRDNF